MRLQNISIPLSTIVCMFFVSQTALLGMATENSTPTSGNSPIITTQQLLLNLAAEKMPGQPKQNNIAQCFESIRTRQLKEGHKKIASQQQAQQEARQRSQSV